ncbi:MAG: NADH-quinone oxidoreductase subunit C [Coriobacteriia bacterium]|nr:NADH-quinone oxidoreductase subunit C [Coriobacteriia bacterium]
MEVQEYIEISLDEFAHRVKSYKESGWRFSNLNGSTVGNEVEIICSFAKGQELENLLFLVKKGEKVPAVSPLFPSAFVGENETHDLYGVIFEGTILDFGGKFYPTSVPTPMNPSSLAAEQFLAEEQRAPASDILQAAPADELEQRAPASDEPHPVPVSDEEVANG